LAALEEPTPQRLVNWGYAAADAGLRSYVDVTLGEPAQFPYPAVGVG
jgi:NTE family protein